MLSKSSAPAILIVGVILTTLFCGVSLKGLARPSVLAASQLSAEESTRHLVNLAITPKFDLTVEARSENGALFLVKNAAGSVIAGGSLVNGWQTYCGAEKGYVHLWMHQSKDSKTKVQRLPALSEDFHSGFAFLNDRELVYWDRTSQKQFVMAQPGISTEMTPVSCPRFRAYGHQFYYEGNKIFACIRDGSKPCKSIEVLPDIPFVTYAKSDGAVAAITNLADVVIFKDGEWCRADREGDTYLCRGDRPPLVEPRKVQFYSSIRYMGKTLVGEWPTGRLYEFKNAQLSPSDLTPPKFQGADPVGYEAQSLAEYCGDLYVGYWPYGELWRRDFKTSEWHLETRLFSHPNVSATFVPYADRPKDGLAAAFYGQRVTALQPYGDGLYAATSGLNLWDGGKLPEFMSPEQAQEYGVPHRLHRPGCQTVKVNSDQILHVVGDEHSIALMQDGHELARVEADAAGESAAVAIDTSESTSL